MSDLFQYGETVDITLRGAQVFSCSVNGLFITLPGSEASVALPVTFDGKPIDSIRVDRVSPAGGPVEPGDVWRDAKGGIWLAFMRQQRHGGAEVWLTRGDSDDDAGNVRAVSGDFGPLTLLFREALVSQPAAAVQLVDATSHEPKRYTDAEGDQWIDDAQDPRYVRIIMANGSIGTELLDRDNFPKDLGPLTVVAGSQCSTCSATGWVHQEGQIGVPGSGCTHGCPDCELGRARLAKGELLEVTR